MNWQGMTSSGTFAKGWQKMAAALSVLDVVAEWGMVADLYRQGVAKSAVDWSSQIEAAFSLRAIVPLAKVD